MAFSLEFSADAERDFGLIFDHLLHSYRYFGESLESAHDHAEVRILEIARLRNASSTSGFHRETYNSPAEITEARNGYDTLRATLPADHRQRAVFSHGCCLPSTG